jgi:hypothetical protein
MKLRIYQPAKTAMQSGGRATRKWRATPEGSATAFVEPVMGWTGQRDTLQQLDLRFDTREEAIAYARRNGHEYEVTEPKTRRVAPKSYADSFNFFRVKG